MKKIFVLLTFVSLLFLSIKSIAQETDFGIRFGAQLSKELSKKIEITIGEECRLNQNASEIDLFLTSLGAKYEISKTFDGGVYYTWIYNKIQEVGFYENRHRLGAWLKASKKINHFQFSSKEQILTTFRDENSVTYKSNPESYLRSRFEVSYNINKLPLNPYLSAQMHYQLNNPKGNMVDEWRYAAGTECDVNKKFTIDAYFMLDNQVNVNNPINTSVIGTTLKFKL